jgi:enoyl-CoA hydratase/carnithine racemase
MSDCIELQCQQAVARVTLHNPKRFNAMSRAMWRELKSVFEAIAQDPALRCVVVAGTGAHFLRGR